MMTRPSKTTFVESEAAHIKLDELLRAAEDGEVRSISITGYPNHDSCRRLLVDKREMYVCEMKLFFFCLL